MDEEKLYNHCRFKNWENINWLIIKKKRDNNCLLIIGNYKIEQLNEIKEIKPQINELMN